MIYLNAAFTQQHAPADLPTAVRAALGKPLRRASALTQLALLGTVACLPAERRSLPTALLWQSTHGPRLETRVMLDEVCAGAGEPMPFEFLATQPALAAAQIQPFLPGLQSAMHFPLDTEGVAHWSLLLGLASNWLKEGRYAQVLCAHLDSSPDGAEGHWLALGAEPLENCQIGLNIGAVSCNDHLPDTPDFPKHLADWQQQSSSTRLILLSPGVPRLTVEFARL